MKTTIKRRKNILTIHFQPITRISPVIQQHLQHSISQAHRCLYRMHCVSI